MGNPSTNPKDQLEPSQKQRNTLDRVANRNHGTRTLRNSKPMQRPMATQTNKTRTNPVAHPGRAGQPPTTPGMTKTPGVLPKKNPRYAVMGLGLIGDVWRELNLYKEKD
jgi:hypothetical protein